MPQPTPQPIPPQIDQTKHGTKRKNYTSKTPQTVGSVEVNVRDTNNGSSGTVTSEGHHERNCSGRTFYLYIYNMVPLPKKSLPFFCFYWYLQWFNNTFANIFEIINFESCAWFWDHCYSTLFWQQYMVGFHGDDTKTHISYT